MKVLLLADCNSVHTIKWATSLSDKGVSLIIFSLGKLRVKNYQKIPVKVITAENKVSREGIKDKLQYLKVFPKIKRILKEEKPDILHAHYATSYGFLGALTKFHPFILSVWGSDVFDFPKKSFFHQKIVEYNLKVADKILSTSHVMAEETKLYTNKSIEVTPFGVDIDIFKPDNLISPKEEIVIGTIKALEEKYGIRYLIEAFKILVDKYPQFSLKLLLVGGGSLDRQMKRLVKKLGLENSVEFTGNIPFIEIPKYHNMLDVYVALSVLDSESFGVAIVEASSCGTPVVVTNVGGLKEVVEDKVTGFVVPKKNSMAAAIAIEKLILDKELRISIGNAGRERVKRLYNWKDNVEQMVNIYKKMII